MTTHPTTTEAAARGTLRLRRVAAVRRCVDCGCNILHQGRLATTAQPVKPPVLIKRGRWRWRRGLRVWVPARWRCWACDQLTPVQVSLFEAVAA